MPLLTLGAWTLFVWGSRIRNIVNDEGWVTHWRMGVSVLFVLVALVLLALVALGGRLGRQPAERLGVGLAAVSSVWWVVRDLGIVLSDHAVGFKIVHTVLAVITLMSSFWVVRSVMETARQGYVALDESR